jgi:nucleoredoxin
MAAALFGDSLVTKGKTTVTPTDALGGKAVVGIYFSAHWCGPCRSFTPELCSFYDKFAGAKSFEIVFASLDKSEKEFDDYFGEMSWTYAIPYGSDLGKKLSAKFKVQGIPTLVLLDVSISRRTRVLSYRNLMTYDTVC